MCKKMAPIKTVLCGTLGHKKWPLVEDCQSEQEKSREA